REQEPSRELNSLPEKQESSLLDAERATPVATPVKTPVITPVSTPVATPAVTPVDTPVTTGVITPVENTASDSQKEPARTSPQYLDATHTASEQRVYSVMYRETVSRGIRE